MFPADELPAPVRNAFDTVAGVPVPPAQFAAPFSDLNNVQVADRVAGFLPDKALD